MQRSGTSRHCYTRFYRNLSSMRAYAVVALPLLANCTTCEECDFSAWRTDAQVTPISYQPASTTQAAGQIAALRRILIIPAEYRQGQEGEKGEPVRGSLTINLRESAFREVSSRGYTVLPYHLFRRQLESRIAWTETDIAAGFDELRAWATASANGDQPNQRIAALAGQLGRALNVDGVLVVQGRGEEPSNWDYFKMGATIMWSSFSDYVLCSARGDLFESASGRIVWRSEKIDMIGMSYYGDQSCLAIAEGMLPTLFSTLPRALSTQ